MGGVYREFAGPADAPAVPTPDETFIVRVRRLERDAVIEQPRLSRRRQVRDVSQVGALILRWLGPTPDPHESDDGSTQHDDGITKRRRST
ncbi:MAG: hypothetical protein H0T69_11050 [Thermoleophilaceae bacterium]|nr:hypothetical protein [Thermoleophilaceae bacterium]